MSSPQYDPQRNEVYRMEKRGLFGLNHSRLSREDLEALMRLACSKFEVKPPVLKFSAMKQYAGMYQGYPRPTITMSTSYSGGLSAMTMLHELAHYLVHCADPEDYLQPHGPEFVGVYGDLMEATGFVPHGSWRPFVRRFDLKRMETGRLSPVELLAAIKKRAARAARKAPHTHDQ